MNVTFIEMCIEVSCQSCPVLLTWVVWCADGSSERLAHHPAPELEASQQLSVVIRGVTAEIMFPVKENIEKSGEFMYSRKPVVQEPPQSCVCIWVKMDLESKLCEGVRVAKLELMMPIILPHTLLGSLHNYQTTARTAETLKWSCCLWLDTIGQSSLLIGWNWLFLASHWSAPHWAGAGPEHKPKLKFQCWLFWLPASHLLIASWHHCLSETNSC